MAILFISGVNDRSKIGVTIDEEGNLVRLLDGNCSIHTQLPLKEGIDAYLVLFGKGVQQRQFSFSQAPSLIINQIADVDTHRGSLERCIELCSIVDSPVINRPENILKTSRSEVSELLQGIPGLVMPRTVRFNPRSPEEVFEHAEKEGFNFPFILRVAGDHGGKSMSRVDGAEGFKALHAYPFDGRAFYLTEYVNCRDNDGLYHRQRLVVIDGEPVLRGSLYDKDWVVHGASRKFMMIRDTWDNDHVRSQWFENEVIPKALPAVREMTKRLKLDIYGIDCSLSPDGEMLVFEANANMNILTNDHPEMIPRMNMIKSRLHHCLARHSGEQVI